MNIESFIVQIRATDIYVNITKNLKTRFDYKLSRPFPRGKNKKMIRLMKYELDEKWWQKCIAI